MGQAKTPVIIAGANTTLAAGTVARTSVVAASIDNSQERENKGYYLNHFLFLKRFEKICNFALMKMDGRSNFSN